MVCFLLGTLGGDVPVDADTKRLSDLLESDHERIERVAQQLIDDVLAPNVDSVRATYKVLTSLIHGHMDWEETFIFVCYEERTGLKQEGPTVLLRREHQTILARMRQLDEMISSDCTPAELLVDVQAFCAFIVAHDEREERVIYDVCEHIMSPQENTLARREWTQYTEGIRPSI